METRTPRRRPQFSISLPPDLIAEIDARADANLRDRTREIEWLLRRGIEADKRGRKKVPDTA